MPLSEIALTDERALQDIADALAGSHKVLLITGAGISTSIGIPDFRSKDGLYNLIPEQTLPTPPSSNPSTPSRKRKAPDSDDEDLPSSQSSSSSRRSSTSPSSKLRGQDLFDSRVFLNAGSTSLFYRFITSLRQKINNEVKETSATHNFIKTLRDGGRLMRCYTQNIDGLEAREGLCLDLKRGKGNKRRFMKKHYEAPLPSRTEGTDFDGGCEVVQLHGDLDTLRCNVCASHWTWTDNETEIFMDGCAPKCQKCTSKSDERQATGKRGLSVGSLRPNIVLYGEDHPSNTLLAPFVPFDAASQPEVLIIMGTSLKVFGLQKIVREFAKAVHAQNKGKGKVIFVNRTRPAESIWDSFIDYYVSMDCDEWVNDLKKRRADLWLRQGEIDMKVTKPATGKRKRKTEILADEPEQPARKVRISVEILVKQLPDSARPKKTPSTPRHQKPAPLQHTGPDSDKLRRTVLSPLARKSRPIPSPFTNHKQILSDYEHGGMLPGSPKTPTHSPITPRFQNQNRSSLRNSIQTNDNDELKGQENDHNKENSTSIPKQPIFVQIDDDDDDNDDDDDKAEDENPSLVHAHTQGAASQQILTEPASPVKTAQTGLSKKTEDKAKRRQNDEAGRIQKVGMGIA